MDMGRPQCNLPNLQPRLIRTLHKCYPSSMPDHPHQPIRQQHFVIGVCVHHHVSWVWYDPLVYNFG